MDAGRVCAEPQGRRVSSHHRAEPADPIVSGRHGSVQSAADADTRLRHGPQQVPDGQPDVQDRVRQLYVYIVGRIARLA